MAYLLVFFPFALVSILDKRLNGTCLLLALPGAQSRAKQQKGYAVLRVRFGDRNGSGCAGSDAGEP